MNTPHEHPESSNAGASHEAKPAGGWAARLSRVLDRQLELYQQLDARSAEQGRLIESEETDQLLEVLRQRQVIVDQITDLNAQMQPYRDQWDELAASIDESQRDALRSRFDELGDAARRIVLRDDADRARLEGRRRVIASELASLSKSKGAVAAYAAEKPQVPMLQDRSA